MRITVQLLKKAAACPPDEATYLDLSGKNIVDLERLECCTRVQTLVLRENCLAVVRDVECCRELWNIDLTGNKVRALHGLSRFPVLGSLVLGYNALEWQDLQRLMHIHLLRLTLAGCPNLDSDPNYRAHVISILPNLWMLDGQLITAGERKQMKQFFIDSASSARPVRPKLSSTNLFTPSNLKNLIVTGVYGERTTHMMTRFPLQCSHNIDLDRKRLMYLSVCMEKDLELENQYLERKGDATFRVPGLQKLLETRASSIEQCNMVLLLLAAKLEFKLPFELMESTLETARLSHIEGIVCSELFQLPDHVLLNVVSLLFSAASIDREGSKEGGLYDQLYECLQYTLYSLHRKVLAPTTSTNTSSSNSSSSLSSLRPVSSRKTRHTAQHHHRCLLASEVVHLMCLVPLFFDSLIEANHGVTELVSAATRSSRVGAIVGELTWNVHSRGGDVWDLYQDIASYLLQETSDKIISKKGAFSVPSRPAGAHSIQHTTSQIIQQSQRNRYSQQPVRAQSAGSHHKHHPGLGDSVLCSPQKVARIVALPEGHVAVLQLSGATSQDSYFYVDTRGLVWDSSLNYWTRDDLSSELSSGRLMPSPELTRKQGRGHATSLPPSRPHSQLSNYSEDLHALSSVEEVLLEEGSLEGDRFHMSVNIMDRSNSSPTRRRSYTPEQLEEVKLHHQTHVLQQYRDTSPSSRPSHRDASPTHEDRTASVREEAPGVSPSLASLSVPTPQLNLPTTWKSTTSIPSPHPASHTCERETRPYSSLSDRESLQGSTIDLSPFHEHRPQTILQAWTAPAASSQPKTTMLSATRRKPSATSDRRQNQSISSTQVKSAGGVRGSSSSLSLSRPSSRQSSSAVVLHPRPSSTSLSSTSSISSSYPLHMSAYLQHSRAEHSKHRYQPRPQTGGKVHGTRKLGDLRHLSVLGSSAW